MADAPALGAGAAKAACRFDPDLAYQVPERRRRARVERAPGEPAPRRTVRSASRTYTLPAMLVTTTPAPKSSVLLEVELPPERLDKSIDEAVRRLARRTKVAGFRPGKAPAVHARAGPRTSARPRRGDRHLLQDAYRDALNEEGIVPLTQAGVDVVQAEDGKPFMFTATVQVRARGRRSATTGTSTSRPRSRRSTTPRSTRSSTSCATRTPRSGRSRIAAAKDGDYAVIGFVGHAGRRAVRRRRVRADAADPRRGAPDPGLRGQPRRPAVGD